MNLNLVNLSRRKDLFQMEKFDKIDEFINQENQTSGVPSTARVLSPKDIFLSPARINHLLVLNEKDQFRSTQNLRKKSQESKINYQRVIIQKLYKSEHQNASMSKQIKRYEDKMNDVTIFDDLYSPLCLVLLWIWKNLGIWIFLQKTLCKNYTFKLTVNFYLLIFFVFPT